MLGTKDCTADREQTEDGVDDGGLELKLEDAKVIAFPHEHHWMLYQEFLQFFWGARQHHSHRLYGWWWFQTLRCPPFQWEGSRSGAFPIPQEMGHAEPYRLGAAETSCDGCTFAQATGGFDQLDSCRSNRSFYFATFHA